MPIDIPAKKTVQYDDEGNEIVEEKVSHVRMYKYDDCPYCHYGYLNYYPQINVYECPYCGRAFT